MMKPKLNIDTVLFEQYGPLIGGNDLAKVLGYKTAGAFNKSLRQSRIDLRIFDIKGRKGKFAYTHDVVQWINQLLTKSS